MRKLIAVLLCAFPLVGLAACQETYGRVGPDQVLVGDRGDKIDPRNIVEACAARGQVVVRSVPAAIGGGGTDTGALVTCGDR